MTPSPIPDAEASFIVINGHGFDIVYDDRSESGIVPFDSDPAYAIALLSAATGTDSAAEQVVGDGMCAPGYQKNTWDGMTVHSGDEGWWRAEAAQFDILVTASHVSGVRIVTPGGYSVGDSIDKLAQSLPGATATDWGDAKAGGTTLEFDVGNPGADRKWGAVARSATLRGAIRELRAPIWFDADC